MTKTALDLPYRTAFIVNDKKLGMVPLSYWCKKHGVKYNTIQARAWRAGLSDNAIGLVTLDPYGEHKEIFKKVRKINNEGREAKKRAES